MPLLKRQLHGIQNPIVSKNTQNLRDPRYKLSFTQERWILCSKVSTFFDVTKLILDQDFPPILEFKKVRNIVTLQ